MGSRIREKVERLFEVFVEIAKPNGKDEAPYIIQQYPPDYQDKEALMMIPKFAYPCPTDASKVDHFTFVLTDLDSMFRFGYCRHTTGHQTCLCIVSWLPWFEIFYKMLDHLAEIMNRSKNNSITNFLRMSYNHAVPSPRTSVTIVANEDMFHLTAPDPNVLPGIPSSRNLTEYYSAVDPYNMMLIFASMLHERRIYMTSKKLSRLTACIHAAETLLYPMHWQHLYIPVLPASLIDYVSAPMPFLIGVHSNLLDKLKQNRVDVGDAVVVDLDANTVTTEYDDLADLPEHVSSYLKKNLKADVVKNSMKTGDAISMAFLHALVRLIGGYRDALKFRSGEPITFDPQAFVRSRQSHSTQAFLEGMLALQIFQQFIFGRLEILNSGAGFRDLFEQQAILYADKLNSQSTYKEWLKSVKKSGKKGWNGLKIKLRWSMKAAPMMSTAVLSMKKQGKKAMADFKTKLSGLTDNEDKKGSNQPASREVVYTKAEKKRPVTAHAENVRPARPHRPPPPSLVTRVEYQRRKKSPLHSQDSREDGHLHLNYQRVDMNLMTDSDIQAAILRSPSDEMIPNQSEQRNSSHSDSSEETDEASASFYVLHSSDEGRNSTPSSDESLVKLRQYAGDKLIIASSAYKLSSQPVAAPRMKIATLPDHPHLRPTAQSRIFSSKSALFKSNTNDEEHPNTSSKKSTLEGAHLIKLDSSESDPTDSENLDPFRRSLSVSSDASSESTGLNDPMSIQRNITSRVSLTRTKAFRRETPSAPLRTHYLDDGDDLDGPKRGLTPDMLEQLSDFKSLSLSNNIQAPLASSSVATIRPIVSDPLSNHSLRRDSSDLLAHEWSLISLAKGPSIRMPITAQPLNARYTNNCSTPQNTSSVEHCLRPSSLAHVRGARNHQDPTDSNQIQNQGLCLNKQVSEFSQTNQQRPLQPLQPAKKLNQTPNHISAVNHATLSIQQSSMSPRTSNTLNFISPIPSSSTPIIHGSYKHTQRLRSGGVDSSFSSSSSSLGSSLQQSDFLSDLNDIEFDARTPLDKSKSMQQSDIKSKVVPRRPTQSGWEKFY